MQDTPLTFAVDSETGTLRVSGTVDELSGVALRDAITKHTENYSRDLVVDLDAVDFLPSLGVGVLAVALRTAEENGSKIELVAGKGTIAQQVLHICGLPYRTS